MMNARRMRRRILELVDAAKAGGGLRCRLLISLLEELSPDAPVDDGLVLSCLQDLANAGLVELLDRRSYRPALGGVQVGKDHLLVRVTDKGTCLLNQAIDPHPLVEDPRLQ